MPDLHRELQDQRERQQPDAAAAASRARAERLRRRARGAIDSKISADAFGTMTSSSLRNASRRTIGALSTMLVVERISPSLIPSHGSSPAIRKSM